jgi:hypothetical protein
VRGVELLREWRMETDRWLALSSVNVVLVDFEGNRHFVQGRVGQTLRQACEMNHVPLVKDDSNGGGGTHSAVRADYYTESLFGEGSVSPQSHVIISNEWVDKIPSPNPQELHVLRYVPDSDRSAKCVIRSHEISLSSALTPTLLMTTARVSARRSC